MAAAKSSTKAPLCSSDVFCRIRPFAPTGGHAESAELDRKTLESWTEEKVTIATEFMFSKGVADYTFPKKVLGPEATNAETYETTAPALVEAFIGGEDGTKPRNATLVAYGQTGTGKTHTMFGTDASLRETGGGSLAQCPEGWGVFPRVAQAVFDRLAARRFVLHGSAVEFYSYAATDLLNPGSPVMVELDTHMPRGCAQVPLQCSEDVLQFVSTVRANRKSRSTKMNTAEDGHEGSSRSHCAILLQLIQADSSTGKCSRTYFAMMDLAGAERPSKTGEQRLSSFEAMLEVMKGNESIGAQGTMINFELHMIRSAIVAAADCHSKGRKYTPEKTFTTAMIKFLSGGFDGSAMLGMVVCLSPSGANGWETWFSLEYGKDMARLRTPALTQAVEDVTKKLQKLDKEVQAAMVALQKTPPKGAPSSQYYASRLANAYHLSQYIVDLAELAGGYETMDEAKKRLADLQALDKSSFLSAMNPAAK